MLVFINLHKQVTWRGVGVAYRAGFENQRNGLFMCEKWGFLATAHLVNATYTQPEISFLSLTGVLCMKGILRWE